MELSSRIPYFSLISSNKVFLSEVDVSIRLERQAECSFAIRGSNEEFLLIDDDVSRS